MKPDLLIYTIKSHHKTAQDTFEVSFSPVQKDTPFSYAPGQHVEITIPNQKYTDEGGNTRTFSIVSAPHEGVITVCFRFTGSAFKKSLLEMSASDEVEIAGPFGFFTVDKNEIGPLLFIAGGIGITPFMSILRSHHHEKKNTPITLLYVNEKEEKAPYHQELSKISKESSWFTYTPHYGRLDETAIQKSPHKAASLIYIAGPAGMVAGAVSLLQKEGIPRNKFLMEEFTGY